VSDSVGAGVEEQCISHIKAFVRGGREGLDRLRAVLPSIFKTFPDCSPMDVLSKCGLEPYLPYSPMAGGSQYPTFFFDPMSDGMAMIRGTLAKRKRSGFILGSDVVDEGAREMKRAVVDTPSDDSSAYTPVPATQVEAGAAPGFYASSQALFKVSEAARCDWSSSAPNSSNS
jgi:hypothetical protein